MRAALLVGLSWAILGSADAASPGSRETSVDQSAAKQDGNPLVDAARAQLDRARELVRAGKYDEAIAVFDSIVAKYGASKDQAVLTIVARAMYGKGSTVRHRGQNEESLNLFDRVIDRFGNASAVEQRRWAVWALIQKGETLTELNRPTEGLSVYEEAMRRAGADASFSKEAAVARYDKGMGLIGQHRNGEALAALDDVVNRFGGSPNPEIRELVVLALDAKAIALEQAGKNNEALVAYEQAVNRYGGATDLSVRAAVAKTMVDEGITLRDAGDMQGTLRVNDEVIRRFGDAKEPEFKQWIATAHLNRGVALASLGRLPEARQSFDAVVRRFGDAPDPAIKDLVANAERALRQLDQPGSEAKPGSVPSSQMQLVAPVPTFETAMTAPADVLARSYLHATTGLRFAELARGNANWTIVTPDGTINKDTAPQWQKVFAARQATYRQAIERRGAANFAGKYRLKSQSDSCKKTQSSFALFVADQRFGGGRITITQSGFELKLKLTDSPTETPDDAYAVENTFAFTDPMNGDYVHIAELNGNQLIIRPQADVLKSWPTFERAPKEEDIRSCSITLVRE